VGGFLAVVIMKLFSFSFEPSFYHLLTSAHLLMSSGFFLIVISNLHRPMLAPDCVKRTWHVLRSAIDARIFIKFFIARIEDPQHLLDSNW
jgi:hypothetical protein